MSITYPSESIWLPGRGELNFRELEAARAVEDYDSDLTLGQDRRSGQWAVFLPDANGEPFPVLGLGHELPNREQITERLYKADVRRRGREIVDEMEAHQERAEREFAAKTDEATQEVAEAIVSHMNAAGTNPFPTVYIRGRGRNKQGNKRIRSA